MQIPEIEIIVSKDGAELSRKTVQPGDYVIGRDAGCEVRVEIERVAPRHAQLIVNFDHALIEDLGSDTGTFVNGQVVKEVTRLWPNQKIQVGAATLELRRLKTVSPPDVSLAPSTAAVKRLLPEEFLHEKKYDIGGVVAQGGMGAILNAKEVNIERTVAMKVMLDGSSPDDLTRFVAEAKVTGQLEHPNIVPVHELGVDENDQVYYTMKFVKGGTLKKVLEQMAEGDAETLKKYPLQVLLTIFQKVCDAIAFAHSKGVIHRDLKPENIMLGDFGEALVMDWGLAKVIGQNQAPATTEDVTRSMVRTLPPEASGATLVGSVVGTPQYMAPEQARGEVDELDRRADIYSLGAILYYMLALRPSVTGKDPLAIVAKVSEGAIEPLTAPKNRTIPESIAAVVRKAMAFDREQRYPHVADLQRDIAAYQNGRATRAENASVGKQLVLLVKRHKALFSTAAAAWLIITALAVWFVVDVTRERNRATANERRATQNAELAAANEQKALREKEATRRALAKSQIALAEAAYREENAPAMQDALNTVPEDLRDTDWHYLVTHADTSLGVVTQPDEWAKGVAADPTRPGVFAMACDNIKPGIDLLSSVKDLKMQIVFIEARLRKRLEQFDFKLPQQKFTGNLAVAVSPDGNRVAIGAGKEPGIVIHEVKSGRKLAECQAPRTVRLEFSPDGRSLLQPSEQVLSLFDASSGKLLWSYQPGSQPGTIIQGIFMPDGKQVMVYGPGGFKILNATDGSVANAPLKNLVGVQAFAFQPDGKAFLAADITGRVRMFDSQDWHPLFESSARQQDIRKVAFTGDGKHFITMANLSDGRRSIEIWDTSAGKSLRSLLGVTGDVSTLAVHPLSHEMIIAGATTRLWDVGGTAEIKNFYPYFWGADELVFAPVKGSAKISLQNIETDRTVWSAPDIQRRLISVSTDGQLAALMEASGVESRHVQILRKDADGNPQEASSFNVAGSKSDLKLRLSPNGDRLVVALAVSAKVYDSRSGWEKPATLDVKGLRRMANIAWTSDGAHLIGLVTANVNRGVPGAEEQIVIWDAATGRRLQSKAHTTPLDCLAVSPDGRTFVEAGGGKTIRIRDIGTLEILREFRAHDGSVTALAWSPKGTVIASASVDLTVKLWDVETGKLLQECYGPTEPQDTLNFSPSGKRLACSGFSHTTRIWDTEALTFKTAMPK